MAASLRVGEKVRFGFRQPMTDHVTNKLYATIEGVIEAMDEHGVRFSMGDGSIQWLPWDFIGISFVTEPQESKGGLAVF